jgi:threonine/homoserine/homoserine lactone efflux protein
MSDAFLSFLLACLVIELTPGPNMTYLMAISSVHGKKAGLSTVAGIALGLLVIGLIAGAGSAALILESPTLYHSLRWAGIFYMVWLAWDNWRTPQSPQEIISTFDVRYFRRGFITNMLNPKAMIFYITVFPTFIDPARPVMPQSIVMTFIYVGIATSVHGAIAILGNKMRPYLHTPAIAKVIRYFFTALLLGIAIWFAWSTQAQPIPIGNASAMYGR